MRQLKHSPVRIAGEWQPVALVGHLDWAGFASADEPITALAICRDATGTHWSRAGRAGATSLSVKFSVRPIETNDGRREVQIRLAVQPVGPNGGVAWLGVACRLARTASLALSLDHHHTGEVAWLLDAPSDMDIRLGALMVCEADTQSARNHLWHLRAGTSGPTPDLTEALNRGRHGSAADI
jgi:hypothetical protein